MSEPRWIVGVDIGGTNVVVGLVPLEGGEPRSVRSFPTLAERGAENVVERVAAAVQESVSETRAATGAPAEAVAGMGIGSPGPLDRATGVVLDTPNLGWKDFPLRELLSRATGFRATLDNDANCATYGEWWQGAGRGVASLVGITLGTGIGGGIILNGELVHGTSDAAGEIGHMSIEFTGRRCNCGNYGCLEAYCSGPNIAARAREGIEAGAESLLPELVDGELDRITAATVYEAVVLEDSYANEVMTETAKILGVGIANIINVLNPEVVVIAGGVTRAGPHLFAPLRSEI
ncbi:MAG TPA: ROK family protein, partial [Longimicrobiales bacterium]|nr:ROK family protein [Longimicrobiales bacterium]